MPFEMSYTSPTSTVYANSFWLISMISLNHLNHTGILHFNGYADVDSFNAGDDFIGQQSITVNDSVAYDGYIGNNLENPDALLSFYWFLETAAQSVSDFFLGATQFSPAQPESIEIGGESSSRVNVVFSSDLTGIGAGAGVAIKVNGVSATIIDADQNLGLSPAFAVYYDLSAPVSPGDVVTWEYDSDTGVLTDSAVTPLHSLGPIEAANTVGGYWQFNDAKNSAHILLGL